ncbi:MAG TPA: hypothetical protein VMH33_08465 [Solirubrobacterales bacterium]|nr:hypothetical protein [Solirubrobacterales bacterium]
MRVDGAVVGLILQRVLVPEREWVRGLEEELFEPRFVKAKIDQGLELAAEWARSAGEREVDLSLAEVVYEEIRRQRIECEFPFTC